MSARTAKIPRTTLLDFLPLVKASLPDKMLHLAIRYGRLFQYSNSPPSFLITDPDDIERVLKKNLDNYTKKLPVFDRLGAMLGKGLLTTMGPAWVERRRVIQPAFHRAMLQKLAEQTVIITDEMLIKWQQYAERAEPLNIVKEVMPLVLRISLRVLFTEDISLEKANELVNLFGHAQQNACRAMTLNPRFPTPRNIMFHVVRNKIEVFARFMIEKRRKQAPEAWPEDLLSILLRAQTDGLEYPLTDAILIDEIITFMATGHETTGNALGWTWYCLGKNPDCQAQLAAEAKAVLSGGSPTFADLDKLIYARQIFLEGLRLYPTIWSLSRNTVVEDELSGYRIPANSSVTISAYVMHRLPCFWEAPEQFDPERFSEANVKSRPKFIYIPFNGGPHTCIANSFSLLKAQLILAMIAQRFSLQLLPESQVIPLEALISLRPAKPIRFILKKV